MNGRVNARVNELGSRLKVPQQNVDLLLGQIAINTVADIRKVFFDYAHRNYRFREYMMSRKSPDDAQLVKFLIAELEGALDRKS